MRTCWNNQAQLASTVALAAALVLVAASAAMSMPRYNDGCQDCHGPFTSGLSPKGTIFPQGSNHEMHRGQGNMNTDCTLCHSSGDGRNPYINYSDGTPNNPGVGCLGCHGRDYGGMIGNTGAGLRAHHAANDVLICSYCHTEDPLPLPENIAPIYYGTPDTNVGSPCNASPEYQESWSLDDEFGLDNDGDDLYDGNDPDCAIASCAWDCGDNDGIVGIVDFLALLAAWGSTGPCDFDGSGVGITDFLQVLANGGSCPP